MPCSLSWSWVSSAPGHIYMCINNSISLEKWQKVSKLFSWPSRLAHNLQAWISKVQHCNSSSSLDFSLEAYISEKTYQTFLLKQYTWIQISTGTFFKLNYINFKARFFTSHNISTVNLFHKTTSWWTSQTPIIILSNPSLPTSNKGVWLDGKESE